MRFVSVRLLVLVVLLWASGCSLGNSSESSQGLSEGPVPSLSVSGPNVLAVTVNGNGQGCGFANNATLNMPCVSVTICAPGTSNCQTIPNILLDTGSWGLRVFRYAEGTTPLVTIPMTQALAGSPATLSECVTYLGSETQWGPVMIADVKLGSEPVISSLPDPAPRCELARLGELLDDRSLDERDRPAHGFGTGGGLQRDSRRGTERAGLW